jgi:hypothetical protein
MHGFTTYSFVISRYYFLIETDTVLIVFRCTVSTETNPLIQYNKTGGMEEIKGKSKEH